MNVTRPGRYALDRAGKLHPIRRRYWADIVAIVHVQPVKRKAAAGVTEPVTPPAPPPRPKPKLIDLSHVPSSMELRAQSWRGKP